MSQNRQRKGFWDLSGNSGEPEYIKFPNLLPTVSDENDNKNTKVNMSPSLGIFTNKTDIFRALKQHLTPDETVKMVFADPFYKDALTAQMTNDPKELTKFVALDLLVSLVIYNQNGKRDKELYLKLKPLIQSIFSINELYDKEDLKKYGMENDLFISEEYEATIEEIQNALPKEFLLDYIRKKVTLTDLFDVDTLSLFIEQTYIKTNSQDITQTPCNNLMIN
jgi:hypothetical protein